MEASSARTVVVDLLAILFITLCLGLASAVEARAEARERLVPMKAADAEQGTLLFRGKGEAETCAAPLLHTDVEIKVSGLVARAHVTQTFRNSSDEWFEGVYVFPLPENSAVDRLRMRIGERVVEGEIRERAAAKKAYEAARDSGRRAALLEQERPNVFTSSVANIGPREDIVVEIEYQQTLRYDAGAFSLRFPMTVGARYIPGAPLAGRSGSGWSPDTVRVADASRITPPVLHPSMGPINPVSIRVELDAGVPLTRIDSPYHRVRLEKDGPRKDVVELDDGATPANRDFELTWTPAVQSAPRAAWFAEKRGDRTYGLLMILPPPDAGGERRIPR
ncbi:MAG TPA: VIT domain-containing protein, partial [Burkholderiales bacterium]|nr:VIT domain-containing protein [Burkholderiales bacterium]